MAIVLMTRLIPICVIAMGAGILRPTAAAEDLQERLAAADLERGRRLYEVSCDACHNANVHWRDKRLANSWPALLAQVDRWQRNAGQRWEASEINDVAAYLNERFYRLPCPVEDCGAKTAHADRH